MKFSDSQLNRMFQSGETFFKQDGSTFRAFHDIENTETDGVLTEAEYLYCREGDIRQGDIVTIHGKKHKVQFVRREGDGTQSAFVVEHVGGGNYGKYQ
ncbi:hypothetical protein F0A71_10415 [Salmonella enterica]|uniref:Uncharacterized protein n=1 Tax=Salmonella muenchen TaxID=596 RepID=A0A735CQL4_SALMU|nr:hypothetical protein [Salmonella enterica]EKR1608661.1 hypothetical protein [Salmonella enterica subsp. enterica serovar Muenchen]ELJ2788462.1 hypothetical protein [Salmonella enterica subsp. enterica]ECQ3868519.1 hypothetical protein [Salmonella enterica]ECX4004883.1 hypothetical protein [Salmonella enterica]